MTEDEMVEWHHRCNGHEFEQASGIGDGQRRLEKRKGATGDKPKTPSDIHVLLVTL